MKDGFIKTAAATIDVKVADCRHNENEIIIKIIDNAGGIPEEIKQDLFKKILTTRGTKGTGLRFIPSG